MERRTALERALRLDPRLAVGSLLLLSLGCWAWLGPMARDMYGSMQGPSAWMMTARWDLPFTLLMTLMWVAMMAAMMLPSAVPAMLLFGSVARSDPGSAPAPRIYLFAAGYLAVWAVYAVVMTLVQRQLSVHAVMSPMMEISAGWLSGLALVSAGLYQLTPLKHACLRVCQSPATFIANYWRKGRTGAFSLGLWHGGYCVGCCWALMLLLFVTGVMNLTALVGLTVLLTVEKLCPRWVRGQAISGALLSGYGLWMLIR